MVRRIPTRRQLGAQHRPGHWRSWRRPRRSPCYENSTPKIVGKSYRPVPRLPLLSATDDNCAAMYRYRSHEGRCVSEPDTFCPGSGMFCAPTRRCGRCRSDRRPAPATTPTAPNAPSIRSNRRTGQSPAPWRHSREAKLAALAKAEQPLAATDDASPPLPGRIDLEKLAWGAQPLAEHT